MLNPNLKAGGEFRKLECEICNRIHEFMFGDRFMNLVRLNNIRQATLAFLSMVESEIEFEQGKGK